MIDEYLFLGIGLNLQRIIAVKDFAHIKEGQKGGYIQSEKNLDQEGNAWIAGTAGAYDHSWLTDNCRVCGNARVSDHAVIRDTSRVSGGAKISGRSIIGGSAWVVGDACITNAEWDISPLQIQGTRHYFTVSAPGYISLAGFVYPIEFWINNYVDLLKTKGYNDSEMDEYATYIQTAVAWSENIKGRV